jgi:uncharacterized protein
VQTPERRTKKLEKIDLDLTEARSDGPWARGREDDLVEDLDLHPHGTANLSPDDALVSGSRSLKRAIYCPTFERVRFVWDDRKAAANFRKHGVSFEEASTAFDDDLGAYYPDSLHQDRFILVGYSRQQRLLYVVHAEVTRQAIRIISARKATRNEKAHYEND